MLHSVFCSKGETPDLQEVQRHVGFLDRALLISCRENGLRQWTWFRGGTLDTSPIPGGKLAYFDHPSFARWRGRISDPQLDREVTLLHRQTLLAQFESDPIISPLSTRIIERLKAFRPVVRGRVLQVSEAREILATEPSSTIRRQVWEALFSAAGRSNRKDLARLIKRRTALARSWGYRSFYEALLDANGLKPGEVEPLLEALEKQTRKPYMDLVVESEGTQAVPVWDIPHLNHGFRKEIASYLGDEKLLPRVRQTLGDMGFESALKGITVDAVERPGRSAHYFTFPVEIPGDIRVLVTPGRGLDPYRFTFHEFGHALYYQEVRQPMFVLRLPGSAPWSEGLAKTLERIPFRPGWLVRYAGVPEEVALRADLYNQRDELVKIRRFLALCDFERKVYEDPRHDPAEIYWASLAEYQAIRPLPSHQAWASDIHLVTQPLSNLWYVMARVIQAQIHRAMHERCGAEFGSLEAGRFLREELYRDGASRDWKQVLRAATGLELSVAPYLEDELGL